MGTPFKSFPKDPQPSEIAEIELIEAVRAGLPAPCSADGLNLGKVRGGRSSFGPLWWFEGPIPVCLFTSLARAYPNEVNFWPEDSRSSPSRYWNQSGECFKEPGPGRREFFRGISIHSEEALGRFASLAFEQGITRGWWYFLPHPI